MFVNFIFYTGLVCNGRPKYSDIDSALSEVVKENSILYTDKLRITFSLRLNIILNYIKLKVEEKLWIFIILKELIPFIIV